jgi:formamidopyrimidine-DNA glycosylase
MPELPEVETVRRGIFDTVVHHTIVQVFIRDYRLRWPICEDLPKKLINATVFDIQRRSKYLLFLTQKGTLIMHLGMSGRVHLFPASSAPLPKRHDHVDILFSNGWLLRYTDPRRFGSLLWTEQPAGQHKLLRHLGPEPLSPTFTGAYLHQKAQGRKVPVKSFLMDSGIVVGVGNIYANEALFKAGIAPSASAGSIPKSHYQVLVKAIKIVLRQAIKAGGTTLNDFQNARGEPGYFSQELAVYGRDDQPCRHCHSLIIRIIINQRSTFYCPQCQAR